MKTGQKWLWMIILLIIGMINLYGQRMEVSGDDRTLSPYFFVKGDDSGDDLLPLKSTKAEVNIAGVIADARITQIYKNEGRSILEAIYIFPASTRAAVYAMKMTIGEREIIARIEERKKARQDYEKAIEEGRTASLLEQQRPNVFQMSVGNILPGDEIKVELKYTELLVSEAGIYQFVYPTVVGPRYSNQTEEQAAENDRWVKNPYLPQGEDPTCDFNIDVDIAAGMPIKDIASTSHEVDILYQSADRAAIRLIKNSEKSGNRDYILKYRLTSEKVEPGLILYRGEKENFFLMMLQPPKQLKQEQIPPREYIFIVDVSGSMNGFPLDISKKLMRDLIGNLKSGDRFNVLLFAAGSSVMADKSVEATEANVNRAIRLIENERGGGGTEILPALKRALALPKSEGYSRTIIIATDGYVNVEKETFDLIRKNLGKANMFGFGIGSSVNRFIIEGIGRVGMGESFVITKPEQAASIADKFRKYISAPALTNISYNIEDFNVYDLEPVAIPDVFAERPVLLFGKWRGEPKGEIILSGSYGDNQKYRKRLDVSDYKSSDKNHSLKYLWARYRIALLGDYNKLAADDERIKEITNMGLTYNLLTDYTSFIAADTEIRNDGQKVTTVRQPLPLPQGVSNLAVSGYAGGGYMQKSRSIAPAPGKYYQTSMDAEEVDIALKADDVSLEEIKAHKTSYEQILRQEILTFENQLQLCYNGSAVVGKTGNIKVQLVVDKDGKVKAVKILKSGFKDTAFNKCLKTTMITWQFSAPDVSQDIKVICVFKFGVDE